MRLGIDEPLKQPNEEPVDISKRLMEVRQEAKTTRARLAELKSDTSPNEMAFVRAFEAYRHARIVLDYWERKAALAQQVFEITVDSYAFHIIGVLNSLEVARLNNQQPSIE